MAADVLYARFEHEISSILFDFLVHPCGRHESGVAGGRVPNRAVAAGDAQRRSPSSVVKYREWTGGVLIGGGGDGYVQPVAAQDSGEEQT